MKNAGKTIMILITAFLFIADAKSDDTADLFLTKEIVTLKPSAVVTEQHITLEDIFSGISENLKKPVATSPTPGSQITLDAKQLYRIAKALNLDWRPLSMQSSIVISRASNVVRNDEIESAVIETLKNKGIDNDSEIAFNNRDLEVHIPVDVNPSIIVRDLNIDTNLRRFSGIVDVVANEISYGKIRISGQIFPVTLIPVLANAVSSGAIIKDNDIALETIRADQIRANTILDQRRIIGMEAKRNLRKGNTIQMSELDKPVLVTRNQIVSVVITTPYMNLTAKGQALENGSEGDLIKVVNTRSGKTIQARITGEATVAVEVLNNTALVAMK